MDNDKPVHTTENACEFTKRWERGRFLSLAPRPIIDRVKIIILRVSWRTKFK